MPIFLGFSLDTIIVASFRNPEIRTGLGLKAGNFWSVSPSVLVVSASWFPSPLDYSMFPVYLPDTLLELEGL